jgi:hypothetical protein
MRVAKWVFHGYKAQEIEPKLLGHSNRADRLIKEPHLPLSHSLASVTSGTQRNPVSRISFFWMDAAHSKMVKLTKGANKLPVTGLKGATGGLKRHFSTRVTV